MPNPFGITEVDIPGALGAYEAGQTARVNRLLRQQQADAAEREADRRQRFDEILLGNVTRPQAGAKGAYTQPTAPNVGQQVSNGINAAVGVPSMPAPAAPSAPSYDIPPDVLRTLTVLAPERAGQIVTALNGMDTGQRARMSAANLYMANAAQHLRGVPIAQRAAELQRIAPDLLAHGVTQQQLQSFTPDDNSLDYVIQSAMDVERLASVANPQYRNVGPGDDVINLNSRDVNGRPRAVYRSDVMTINGVPYPRPTAPTVTAPTRELPPGFVVQPANGTAPAFSGNVPLTLEDRRSQYPTHAPGRAGPQGPRTFR